MKTSLELRNLDPSLPDQQDYEAHTTVEFLDGLKDRLKIKSDYQLAKELGVSHTRISNWRRGRNTFDERIAVQVAHLLTLDPAYVLACMAAERSKRADVKTAWKKAAQRIGMGTAAVVAAVLLGADQGAQLVEIVSASAPALYIMSNAALAVTCALALASLAVLYSQQRRQQ